MKQNVKNYTIWLIGMSMLWLAFPPPVVGTPVIGRNLTIPADRTDKEVSVNLGDLVVNGNVTESARVTMGDAVITGRIGDDLTVTIGDAHIKGQVIGKVSVKQGDLFVTGEIGNRASVWLGDATVSGKINGSLFLRNGDLYLKGGTINGDVEVMLGDVSLEGGKITGSLTVRGGKISGDIRIVEGTVYVIDSTAAPPPAVGDLEQLHGKLEKISKTITVPAGLLTILLLVILSMISFLVALALVMVVIYVFRIPTGRAGLFLKKRELLRTFLSGLGGFLIVSAATILLVATLVFIPVAILLIALTLIGLIFGFAVVVIVTGRAFFKELLNWDLPDWLSTILAFLLLSGILLLPVSAVNILTLFVYLVLSLGVTLRTIFSKTEVLISEHSSSGVRHLPENPTPASDQGRGSAGETDRNSLSAGNT